MLQSTIQHARVGPYVTLTNQSLRHVRSIAAERRYRDVFLLASMRKSGTNYTKNLLANYLGFRFLGRKERIDFKQMLTEIWDWPPESEDTRTLRAATGYRAWTSRHDNMLVWFSNARTIVQLYRNPLDTFVSRYYYYYVNRRGRAVPTIDEAIELEVPRMIWEYVPVRLLRHRSNVMTVAYERLVRDPGAVLREMLETTGLDVDDRDIARSVQASTPEQFHADEKRYLPAGGNLYRRINVGSFVRSGRVGEWRDVLEPRQVDRIRALLGARGVLFDEFLFE